MSLYGLHMPKNQLKFEFLNHLLNMLSFLFVKLKHAHIQIWCVMIVYNTEETIT